MDFGLLGRLTVSDDDAIRPINSPKQRMILAGLLLQANTVVSIDHLIDIVWHTHPPRNALAALHNQVMRLRQALGPPLADRIKAHMPGYLIEVRPDELDLHRFTRWHERGAQAIAAGNWHEAQFALRQAAEQWRGTPLLDVPSETLHRSETARLTELRIEAQQARIDADLALGNAHALIPEIRQLADAHPLRERAHAQLMLAQYRAGRQVEALDVYRHLRQQLVTELGIEPSSELQLLHRQILAADPLLTPTNPADQSPSDRHTAHGELSTDPPPRPAPTETTSRNFLPSDVADFTGRLDETRQLISTASHTSRVVVITALDGMAGVGKTTLAVHAAHLLAADFPDGQFFLDLHGHTPGREPVEVNVALHRLLVQVGLDPSRIPEEIEDRASLWRAETAARHAVVLLDNAADVEQVRPLLPGGGCPVLITSRRRLVGLEGADTLSVQAMTVADAVALFELVAGPQRCAGRAEEVAEAVRLCGYLPLAIRITAARLRHRPAWTVADLVSRLHDQHAGSVDLSVTHGAVATAFTVSYRQLEPAARQMFCLLGLHPGPDLDAHAAAAMAGIGPAQAEQLLEEMLDAHLLQQHTIGRYTFHDLLRAYAAERVRVDETEQARRAAVYRMLEYYLHTAHGAGVLAYGTHASWPRFELPPPTVDRLALRDRDQALAWYGAEHPVLVAAVMQAMRTGHDTHAWQIAGVLVSYLLQMGLWRELGLVTQAGLTASSRTGDTRGQAHSHHSLGQLCRSEGHHEPAHQHLGQALKLFQTLGNRSLEGDTLLDIALTFGEQSAFTEAIEYSRRGLTLTRAIGNQVGEGRALNSLGWYLCVIGEHDEALVCCEEALRLSRVTGNLHVEASTLDSIGFIRFHLGHYSQALDYYRDALRLRRVKGDYFLQADVLTKLGDTHLMMGENEVARDLWQQALVILDDLRHRDAEGVRARLAPG